MGPVPAKWLIRKIAERLSNQKIPDLNSGLRAFRREVSLPYLRLLPRLLLRHDHHARVPEQPARHHVRADQLRQAGGESKFHFVRDAYATSSRCCAW